MRRLSSILLIVAAAMPPRRRSSFRTLRASPISASVDIPFGPVPAIGTQAGTPRGADDHAPVIAVGVRTARARGRDIDPGQERYPRAERPGSRSARHLAHQRAVIAHGLALELTQCDARQLALDFQALEPLRASAWSRAVGIDSTSRSSRSSSPVSAAAGLAHVSRRSGAFEVVEPAPAQIFFQRLPRLGRLAKPGLHRGQRWPSWPCSRLPGP